MRTTKIKRRPKPDPLAALRKKYPGKWRVAMTYKGMITNHFAWMSDWAVCDGNSNYIAFCKSKSLARAICKLGNGK